VLFDRLQEHKVSDSIEVAKLTEDIAKVSISDDSELAGEGPSSKRSISEENTNSNNKRPRPEDSDDEDDLYSASDNESPSSSNKGKGPAA
jgi:hypothetical protein